AASPSAAAVRTAALAGVEVHRGEAARLTYRIDAPAGTTWQVTLEVLGADGERALARRIASAAPAGTERELTLVLDLPAGSYTYLVHARDASRAQEQSAAAAELRVLPPLAPGYPGAASIAAALEWAGARSGSVAVAVVDSNGELHGLRAHRTYQAASLAKAILLAACLREHPKPDPALDATATTMIEESDNASANTIFGVVGARGMKAVAALAGMDDYEQGTSWLDARVSAADQARFFYGYLEYVPKARRGFARELLSGITRMQRWGIPAAAGPEGWTVYFKGGWLGLDNHLMNQAAWLDKGGRHWALAVLSDENPSRSYGWDTQKGVTGLLLGREPTAAYLTTVLE
ncbi:MAG: serine hydrolase, partial [Thermoleophilia bacterium]